MMSRRCLSICVKSSVRPDRRHDLGGVPGIEHPGGGGWQVLVNTRLACGSFRPPPPPAALKLAKGQAYLKKKKPVTFHVKMTYGKASDIDGKGGRFDAKTAHRRADSCTPGQNRLRTAEVPQVDRPSSGAALVYQAQRFPCRAGRAVNNQPGPRDHGRRAGRARDTREQEPAGLHAVESGDSRSQLNCVQYPFTLRLPCLRVAGRHGRGSPELPLGAPGSFDRK